MSASRRGFLASLFAAPVVAVLPDIRRPSVFGRARRRIALVTWKIGEVIHSMPVFDDNPHVQLPFLRPGELVDFVSIHSDGGTVTPSVFVPLDAMRRDGTHTEVHGIGSIRCS